MKLDVIINEMKMLEADKNDYLLEAAIADAVSNMKSKVFKKPIEDEINDGSLNKARAIKILKTIKSTKFNDIRSKIINAFINNDIKSVQSLLTNRDKTHDAKDAFYYLELLRIAHNGMEHTLTAAGEKRGFINAVYKLVDKAKELVNYT